MVLIVNEKIDKGNELDTCF